jgi:hypothetical protein
MNAADFRGLMKGMTAVAIILTLFVALHGSTIGQWTSVMAGN